LDARRTEPGGGGSYALWRYPAGGRGEPRLLTQAGLHAITPAVGSASGRLLWVSQNVDVNIWSVGVSGGEKPRVLVASTRRDQDPDAGRDGRLAFRSVRTGASEIWISKPDGSQAFRATNLRGPVTGTPTWSPDGRRLAFDSRPGGNPDIYVIECEGTRCGAPKRLTDDPGADVTPDWSVDGEHIYFSSVRTGGKQVWRVDPEGARPEQVTRNGGLQPRESPDGKWLYYVKGQGQPSLWRMPGPKSATGLSPDAEERVLSDDVAILDSADWVPSNDEIFFAANETGLPRPAMHTIRAYHTGTRKFRRVAAPGTLLFSFGISQDLRQILFCQADRTEANIMVSEGIR
jgi:dipeptidyl aminopeptidase/acylaminoacyl peptidase